MKNKIVLIIPGFKEFPHQEVYKKIADLYRSRNIEPVVLDIDWNNRLMSDYVHDFLKVYHQHVGKEIYTFGFSFGAMISFIASSKVTIYHQLLCSGSPYYKEDLSRLMKSWIKSVGHRRMQDFRSISRKEIVKNVSAKTTLLVGTKERGIMVGVSKSIYTDLSPKKDLIIIKGSGHDISDKRYFEEIKHQIHLL